MGSGGAAEFKKDVGIYRVHYRSMIVGFRAHLGVRDRQLGLRFVLLELCKVRDFRFRLVHVFVFWSKFQS